MPLLFLAGPNQKSNPVRQNAWACLPRSPLYLMWRATTAIKLDAVLMPW